MLFGLVSFRNEETVDAVAVHCCLCKNPNLDSEIPAVGRDVVAGRFRLAERNGGRQIEEELSIAIVVKSEWCLRSF